MDGEFLVFVRVGCVSSQFSGDEVALLGEIYIPLFWLQTFRVFVLVILEDITIAN